MGKFDKVRKRKKKEKSVKIIKGNREEERTNIVIALSPERLGFAY